MADTQHSDAAKKAEKEFSAAMIAWNNAKDAFDNAKQELDLLNQQKSASGKLDKKLENKISLKTIEVSDKRSALYAAQDSLENAIKAVEAASNPSDQTQEQPKILEKSHEEIMGNLETLRSKAASYDKKKKDALKENSNKYLNNYGKTLSGTGRDIFGIVVLLLQIETLKKLAISLHLISLFINLNKGKSNLSVENLLAWAKKDKAARNPDFLNLSLTLKTDSVYKPSWSEFHELNIISFLEKKCLIKHNFFKPKIDLLKLYTTGKTNELKNELKNTLALLPSLEQVSEQKNAMLTLQEMGFDVSKKLETTEEAKVKIANEAYKLIKARRKLYASDWDFDLLFMKFCRQGYISDTGEATELFHRDITEIDVFSKKFYHGIIELKTRLEIKYELRNELLKKSSVKKYFNKFFAKENIPEILEDCSLADKEAEARVAQQLIARRQEQDGAEWLFDLADINCIVNSKLAGCPDPFNAEGNEGKFTAEVIEEIDIVEQLSRDYGGGTQAEIKQDSLNEFLTNIISHTHDLCQMIDFIFFLKLLSEHDEQRLTDYRFQARIMLDDLTEVTDEIKKLNGTISVNENNASDTSELISESLSLEYYLKLREFKLKIYYLLECSRMIEDRIYKDFEDRVNEAKALYEEKEQISGIVTAIYWCRSIGNSYNSLLEIIDSISALQNKIKSGFDATGNKVAGDNEAATSTQARAYAGPRDISFTLRIAVNAGKPVLTGTPLPIPIDAGINLTAFFEISGSLSTGFDYSDNSGSNPKLEFTYSLSYGVAATAELNVQIPYTKSIPVLNVINDAIAFSQTAGVSKQWLWKQESFGLRNLYQLAARMAFEISSMKAQLDTGYKNLGSLNQQEMKILYQTLDEMSSVARLNRLAKKNLPHNTAMQDLKTLLMLPTSKTSHSLTEGTRIISDTSLSFLMHGAASTKQNLVRSETISRIKEINYSDIVKSKTYYVVRPQVCRNWSYVDKINFLGNVISRTIDFQLTEDPLDPWMWTGISATVVYSAEMGFAKTINTLYDTSEKYKALFLSSITGKSDYLVQREKEFGDLLSKIDTDFSKEKSWTNESKKIFLTKESDDFSTIAQHFMALEDSVEFYLIPWINKFDSVLRPYREELFSFTMLGEVCFELSFYDEENMWLIGNGGITTSLELDKNLSEKLDLPISAGLSMTYTVTLLESYGFAGGINGNGFATLTYVYRQLAGGGATYSGVDLYRKNINIQQKWLNFYQSNNHYCEKFYYAYHKDLLKSADDYKKIMKIKEADNENTLAGRAEIFRKALLMDIYSQNTELSEFYGKKNFTVEDQSNREHDDLKPGWYTAEGIDRAFTLLSKPYRQNLDERKKIGHAAYARNELINKMPGFLQDPLKNMSTKYSNSGQQAIPEDPEQLAEDSILIVADIEQQSRSAARSKMNLRQFKELDMQKLIPDIQLGGKNESKDEKELLADIEKFEAGWHKKLPDHPPSFDEFYLWLKQKKSRFYGNELKARLAFNQISNDYYMLLAKATPSR